MKAVCVREFGPYGTAKVEQLEDPVPGPEEVVIGVRAAEANFPDILVMQGDYQIKPPRPFSPGKAAAGIVEAVGEKVTQFKPGDRVSIRSKGLGVLSNDVQLSTHCRPWTFGIAALMRNLAQRGLL